MDKMLPEVNSADATLTSSATALLSGLRTVRPRIHVLTNSAAQIFTANLLLAVGSVPSLTIAEEEVESFARSASALLVNLGTLDAGRRKAFPLAVAAISTQNKPWVLDPVFVEASPFRQTFARELLAMRPAVLRCNAAEFEALSGQPPCPSALQEFAGRHALTVALTGATDLVCDHRRCIAIDNGHPLMAQTTAMGCAGTALIAAFASVTPDPFVAAAAALLLLGVSGDIAAETANGPGTFPACFLDALYNFAHDTTQTSEILLKRARLS